MIQFPTYEVTTPPAAEPISTAEAKTFLRVESGVTDDDALIARIVKRARVWVENYIERKLITQTVTQTLDDWPGKPEPLHLPAEGRVSDVLRGGQGWLELLANPVQSITSVTVYDDAGDSEVWATSNYRLARGDRARLALVDGASWPSATRATDAIEIVYVAGYGDDGSDVPEDIRGAIEQLVAHWYENREAEVLGTITSELKLGVQSKLRPYRRVTL